MTTEIDKAVEHVFTLFREHVERYPQEIVVEPSAWRTRCDELHQDLQWLLFCQAHPLAPKPPRPRD
ncbi:MULTISPECIES: hypothetical protein [unclassified Bradyrhizobium]|uniref:hypothetical protein n=1 Tax=unclassified Bradyrhizobium TaxID=2631580 RepID=UPI001FF917F4|nr:MULTISPECIES: hypothetical protein [unclassified Bradyrhizobium]MCK1311604.1 hypothetical protein [Bradyrhizobium sp. 45]MCK1436840.1 hypothetical protein [Bradyrhizobium sp. 15]MCK1611264.1 hypothetical protein [Bradyrhizobium sp. 163]MCK1761379.1 hypothetical protein [Bradyrhizobium sp. 136]